METFTYNARDERGTLVTGQMEAATVLSVREKLQALGLSPIQIRNRPFQQFEEKFQELIHPVSATEKITMTRQLHTLFKAGMSFDEILHTLSRQTPNPTLKRVLASVQREVGTGSSLAAALALHPKIFDRLYVNLVMAGEEAGILEDVLLKLADLMEKQATIRQRVKSALLYPKIVISVLIGASMVMLTWVVPKFQDFYGHFGVGLPTPTRLLLAVGNFMNQWWWVILLAMAVGIGLLIRYTHSPKGRVRWGKLIFNLPVFGPLNLKIANAQFCHLLAGLYSSGLPMTRCVELCSEVVDNGYFAQEIRMLGRSIVQGKTLSDAMRARSTFTPVIIDATHAGETSGSLDEILNSIAAHYDTEVEYTMKNLSTLLEPMLLFVIFGMVVCFALAIVLPMWGLAKVI